MQLTTLHDNTFLKILWNDKTRVIGIDWKEATSSMTDDDFKAELERFAGFVEANKAHGILVDVARFRHKNGPGVQEWRVKNISTRYSAAGVKRFAFLLPADASVPPMMNQSSPGEGFLTRGFNSADQAMAWLTATD
jgi:hypothetical protein